MSNAMQHNTTRILLLLIRARRMLGVPNEIDGPTLSRMTGLSAAEVNAAVSQLYGSGFVESSKDAGDSPYAFAHVWATPLGWYEGERVSSVSPLADF
jgi:hypothetical protein